jgi:hypothetical protein
MASAEIVMPAMGVLVVLYGVPPLLVVFVCLRRAQRIRALGRSPVAYLGGAAAGAVAFLFNMAVVLPTLRGLPGGDLRLTTLSIVGLAIAWVSFWVWVALGTVLRPSRRTTQERALRDA